MAINRASSLPLHEEINRKNTISRAIELLILFLLFSLLVYRLISLKHHGTLWLVALLCESWFTFTWILVISIKWKQLNFKTYPERLLQWTNELPPVDLFVTTADPIMEPPIITVNTVLSLLAIEYPANKLACYVSDDGCSALTFYALVEASKFAKLWVPFCKKYDIPTRAPFRYFSGKSMPSDNTSSEFQQAWKKMKDGYELLRKKIEYAGQRPDPPCDLTGEFAVFSNVQRSNHPTIIKVIWENKEDLPNGLPHLVYISREKHPKHPHHFKAGAMNVLGRVSGVMTNAPFMLNVDCDMFANDPQVVLRAMCLLLGVNKEEDGAFVQFPQVFYDGLKDDPFGNQLVTIYAYMAHGMTALQGPMYAGTGCFHRRKVIYGLSPYEKLNNEKLCNGNLQKIFGKSMEFMESAAQMLSGSEAKIDKQKSISRSIEVAKQVAGCGYEYGTNWGTQMGWIYGSATEDILTGLAIHGRGWRSTFCSPNPPAFLGCAPSSGPASLTQQKRWATGLLEILFSSKTPVMATLYGKLQFRQCMAYLWILMWGLRSVPELCYAALPAYCILTNTHLLPKVNEPAIVIPMGIFVIYNLYGLSEYIRIGLSVRNWWNNQRMSRVISMTAWLFGFLSAIHKLLGLSQTVFELTQKVQNSNDDDANANVNVGRFTFDKSSMIVSGITVLLLNLFALVIKLLGLWKVTSDRGGPRIGEIICSVWVLLCFCDFFKGLFGSGKYGIPSAIIWKSGALAFLFVHFCKWVSMG